jgi:hypothetical protein
VPKLLRDLRDGTQDVLFVEHGCKLSGVGAGFSPSLWSAAARRRFSGIVNFV